VGPLWRWGVDRLNWGRKDDGSLHDNRGVGAGRRADSDCCRGDWGSDDPRSLGVGGADTRCIRYRGAHAECAGSDQPGDDAHATDLAAADPDSTSAADADVANVCS
jgi:hypothetical protein